MGFLRPLESFIGMFQRLFGMLVSGLVIFLAVVRGCSTVRVCGELVVFGSSLVRVIWHSVSYPWSPLHLGTIRFSKLYNKEHSRRGHAFSNQMKMTVAWIWSRLPPLGRQSTVGRQVILPVLLFQQMRPSGYQIRRTHPSLARYLPRRGKPAPGGRAESAAKCSGADTEWSI